MYLLDTDHLTLLERSGSEGQRILARLATTSWGEVAATIISYEEQTRGWLAVVARARTLDAQIEAYQRLQKHLEIYCSIPVVEFDEKAAIAFRRLPQSHVRIGTMDMKIAAIALANQASVLTRNLSDFGKVPGLRVEDWTT
jgi:tRNA(fMet)-specific endonuclease VapC